MSRKGQGYVKKRKGFHGTPCHVLKKQRLEGEEEQQTPRVSTASYRKLSPGISNCVPTSKNPRSVLNGNYIMDGQLLGAALSKVHLCPGGILGIAEDTTKREGLCATLVFSCSKCQEEVVFKTSANAVLSGSGKSAEINRRSVLAASDVGLGRESLTDMCINLGLAPPVVDSSFQRHLTHLAVKSNEVCEAQMNEAAERLRKKAMEEDASIRKDDVVEVAVSYDGTWHKRGYSSNHGVGVVIAMETGEVLDREVMSRICRECDFRKDWDKESDSYKEWWDGHGEECLANHVGSSGMMEVEAASKIWRRSVTKHKLKYKFMVSDGDSKSFERVKETYGKSKKKLVQKLDCVGHVGKRMYHALDKFRKDNRGKLSDGKNVGGGKGRLTGTNNTGSIGHLCKLYRNAVLKSKDTVAYRDDTERQGAVECMQRAVLAILYHEVKLADNEVRHQYCPDDDWCEYRNTGSMVDKDHHLDVVFLDLLLPTFKRLSAPDLLSRCLPGYTQNQNESFNALIWKRCPKHLWRGPRVVRIAVNLAVIAFNCGAEQSRNRIFNSLNLTMYDHTLSLLQRKDRNRLRAAELRETEVEKRKREANRVRNSKKEEGYAEREGVVYQAGAF